MTKKYSNINFTPPEGVRNAAKRGLELYEEGYAGDGLEQETVRWARKIAKGDDVTPEKARKGNRWFGRNDRFKDQPKDSPAYTAYMLWFGAPGKSWFAKLVKQMDSSDKEAKASCEIIESKKIPEWLKDNLETGSKDLMPLYSVLVSTNWNKNDDIFTPDEVAKACYTPQYKPMNMNHNGREDREKNEIIGVIKYAYTVDENYNPVHKEEDIKHLIILSYIWNQYWPKASQSILTNKTKNNYGVSMECMFDDFGFGLKKENSDIINLLPRNEITDWMTSHLRMYGGSGKINIKGQEYYIGRWLKDITFTGCGIVFNPANEGSIIFSDASLRYINNLGVLENDE